jgi:hypothetical protein
MAQLEPLETQQAIALPQGPQPLDCRGPLGALLGRGWTMNTAWDRSIGQAYAPGSADSCLRCRRSDHREHLMQTNGVAFYRCGACGHMFIVRMTPREPEPDSTP